VAGQESQAGDSQGRDDERAGKPAAPAHDPLSPANIRSTHGGSMGEHPFGRKERIEQMFDPPEGPC
jgi:hypothetical protein